MLLALCKDEAGRMPFSSTSVVFVQELAKLAVSLLAELRTLRWHAGRLWRLVQETCSTRTAWLFSIPALCYAVNNNCF